MNRWNERDAQGHRWKTACWRPSAIRKLSPRLPRGRHKLVRVSGRPTQSLGKCDACVNSTQICARVAQSCVRSAQDCAYNLQMLSRRITSADLAAVGRVDRHRLRNLLKDLPEFAARPANQRVAIEYTRHDLVVVAVLCELERMGLRKDAIARWVTPIQQALSGPRSMNAPQLLLTSEPRQAWLGDEHSLISAGMVVDLDKILRLVDRHCAGVDSGYESQRDLEFGPVSLGGTKSSPEQSRACRHG